MDVQPNGRGRTAEGDACSRTAGERSAANDPLERLIDSLRLVSDYSAEGVIVVDTSWKVRYINRRGQRELRAKRSLEGKNIWDSFPGASEQNFSHPASCAMYAGTCEEFEAEHKSLGWFRFYITPVNGGIHISFRNIDVSKAAEQRAAEAEERFRLSARATNDLIWDWDISSDNLQWNEAAGPRFGYNHDQLGNCSAWWAERVHPDDRERVLQELDLATRGGVDNLSLEYRWMTAGGVYADVLDRAYLMKDSYGEAVRLVGAMQDLTERNTAYRLAKEREGQLATIFDQAMIGIMHVSAEGRALMVNDRYCEILGRSREELMRIPFTDYTHPEDAPANWRAFLMGQQNRKPARYQKRYLRPDGSIVWCDIQVSFVDNGEAEVPSCIAVVNDITDRLATEAELANERRLLQTVVDSIEDLIFVKDRNGRFVLTNRALNEGCGELRGRKTEDLMPQELVEGYESVDQEVIRTGEKRAVEEIIPIVGEDRLFHTVKVPWLRDGAIKGIIGVSRDITERKQAELALQQSESLNRSIVEASADCIKLLDLEGRLLFMNEPGRKAMEIENMAQVYGRLWRDLWPADTRTLISESVERAKRGSVARFSAVCPTAKGTTKWWDVVVSPVRDEAGRTTQLVSISRDITEQKLALDRMQWIATHDGLTSLPNRLFFQEHLAQAVKAAAAGGRLALLQLDLDHFKQVNDTLGHDAGDRMLTVLAERLSETIRGSDIVARLGGDEFAIILPDCAEAEVRRISEQLLTRLREPFAYGGRSLDCRASIGAALYPVHGKTPETLLKSADTALYMAKASGRGTLRFFHPRMRNELQKRTSMLSLGRDAILRDDILPYYQPKIDLQTGAVTGFEALLRWRDRRFVIRSPGEIAACFEDPDLARSLSERTLQGVIRDMRRWLDDGVNFGSVAVNAASAEFHEEGFAERVLQRLEQARIPASCFEIEITETVLLDRAMDLVDRSLKLFSAAGVRIALDDFGTGFASLRHLKQFPVDLIKIDRSFVEGIEHHEDDVEIIRAVITLGQSLRMDVVAEGIETPAQLNRLRLMGCRFGQGHVFAKAMPGAEVPAYTGACVASRHRAPARN